MIYVGQTALRIQLKCKVDITGALEKKIRYRKPDDVEGEWDTTVLDVLTGIIYYDIAATSDIDQAGVWTFWSFVRFEDSRGAPGIPFELLVQAEGVMVE